MKRTHHTLHKQPLKDLLADFSELDYLYTSLLKTIGDFVVEMQKTKQHIGSESFLWVMHQTNDVQKSLETSRNKIRSILKSIPGVAKTQTNLQFLVGQKAQYYDLLRSQSAVTASLITSTDWQSPSFLHSEQSMAGRFTGKIIGTINDYKRDKHFDEQAYEKAFIKEYVDGTFKLPIPAFLTNSGMAAFTTILNFLQMEQKVAGPIVIGKAIYFENKELVKKIFQGNVVEVDEMNTKQILDAIYSVHPAVVIFDSLCNAADIPLPDIAMIAKAVIKSTKDDVYLIIDNTCLSVALQPLPLIFVRTRKVHLIVFESLNKYHQFGMDKVTAGIIWGWGKNIDKLFSVRERSGTNITDTSCYVLPLPNRILLMQRLLRFQRNTSYITSSLQSYLDKNRETKFDTIVYPALPNHPSYTWAKDLPFQGSYFAIRFKDKYRSTKHYQRFLKKIITEAKKQHVQIVAGTSFGFNNTRIYLTSLRSDFGEPFIRVSLGTENRLELEKIKDVFLKVLDKF